MNLIPFKEPPSLAGLAVKLSEARKMANHADTRTTQLYDRRGDTASLGEYEKVGI